MSCGGGVALLWGSGHLMHMPTAQHNAVVPFCEAHCQRAGSSDRLHVEQNVERRLHTTSIVQLMRWTLERAGPAFIKWGQWAATRPDLFPQDICRELAKLHTKAPQHSFAATKRIVEAALGARLSDIFVFFHPAPVASGSIAQVGAPTLHAPCRVSSGHVVFEMVLL